MKYTVKKPVQVPPGTIVSISKEQAELRGVEQVRHIKGSQYEALTLVWFKSGETVGLDDPAKHLLESLIEGSVKPDKAKAEKGDGNEPAAMAEKAAKVLADDASPIQQPDLDMLPAVKAHAATE